MEPDNLKVLPLHKYPEYLKECCDLINEEWPRSETARMMSLQASCEHLPTSLVLINDKKLVIGHCKLTRIPSLPHSCFIETVVINKALRGQKLGTYLMRKVEEHCRNNLKLTMLHLSTKGQEAFYAKLGYEICAPVSIYGTCVANNFIMNTDSERNESPVPERKEMPSDRAPVPPPPPPPPTPKASLVNNNIIKSDKTFMFKNLN